MPEGMEEPPELPPPDGMLGIPPPPPLPPEPPDEPPEEPPLDGEDGEGMEDDCCCGQPPKRKADTVPTAVTWAAATNRRFHEY